MRPLPTLASDPISSLPCVDGAAAALSRRGFVSAATWSVLASALAGACGGGDGPSAMTGPSASGVTFANGSLRVPLASVQSLGQTGGFLITNGGNNNVTDAGGRRADVIVINVGTDQWRAFTSICTHEQCTVADYTGSRIRCLCHGSEFDSQGKVITGPALRALTEYPVSFDSASRTIVVTRG